jgi:hypothetical protein
MEGQEEERHKGSLTPHTTPPPKKCSLLAYPVQTVGGRRHVMTVRIRRLVLRRRDAAVGSIGRLVVGGVYVGGVYVGDVIAH